MEKLTRRWREYFDCQRCWELLVYDEEGSGIDIHAERHGSQLEYL